MVAEPRETSNTVGRLAGRVALVTGAAGGLGRSVCSVLRRDGATVVGVDIQGDGVVCADVGTLEGNRAAVEAAVGEHGRLDILVLNAAVQHVAPITEFTEEAWDRVMDVDLKGPFLAIREAWPHLTARRGGRIIATGSLSSFLAEDYKAAYVAAKHGVVGLIRVAAVEGGSHGLTANAVAPGLMLTGLIEGQLPEQMRIRNMSRDEILREWCVHQIVKRPVETTEVAETISFLASEGASGITGACIPVELGQLAVDA